MYSKNLAKKRISRKEQDKKLNKESKEDVRQAQLHKPHRIFRRQ